MSILGDIKVRTMKMLTIVKCIITGLIVGPIAYFQRQWTLIRFLIIIFPFQLFLCGDEHFWALPTKVHLIANLFKYIEFEVWEIVLIGTSNINICELDSLIPHNLDKLFHQWGEIIYSWKNLYEKIVIINKIMSHEKRFERW